MKYRWQQVLSLVEAQCLPWGCCAARIGESRRFYRGSWWELRNLYSTRPWVNKRTQCIQLNTRICFTSTYDFTWQSSLRYPSQVKFSVSFGLTDYQPRFCCRLTRRHYRRDTHQVSTCRLRCRLMQSSCSLSCPSHEISLHRRSTQMEFQTYRNLSPLCH